MAAVEQCVSGTSLHGFREALAELYGLETVQRGLARLPVDERMLVEQAKAQLWIPMDVLARAVDAWSEATGVPDLELTDRGVRLGTKRTMPQIIRVLLRVTTDEALVTRTHVLYSRLRNTGHLASQMRGDGVARLTLTEWQNGTDRQLLSLAAAVESLLELTGRTHVRSTQRRTPDGGVIDIKWGNPSVPPRPFT